MTHPLAATPPAGGAAFHEIIYAAAIAGAVILFVGWEVLRERTGHRTVIGRLADRVSEIDGLPRWVGLPSYLALASLITAGWGVWWDVPIHMQNGRDAGPLANPAHYPIFLGILGFAHAGILSVGLTPRPGKGPLPRRTLRISKTWRAPYGALVIVAAGQIALLGFPADDLWHRLFGQDVTEWGPTHVMMIGGAVTCILGIPLLLAEAYQLGAPGTRTKVGRFRFLVALSMCYIPFAFLMEFDLGVPQYPAATQFIIAGFLMGWVFCACRIWFGPGGALLSAAIYLVVHGFLWFSIAALPDVLQGRFLLFVPGAILVELVALVVSPRTRPVLFGVVSGVAIGTLGLFAEWGWSQLFMPLPQPFAAHALPFFLATGTAAAVGGGVLAVWQVARLRDVAEDSDMGLATSAPAQPRVLGSVRWHGLVGVGIFIALMAAFAPPTAGSRDIEGAVALSDVTYNDGRDATECDGTEKCLATVTVVFSPADAIDDAASFYSLSWQGLGNASVRTGMPRDPEDDEPGIMRIAMVRTGEGTYRSAQPIPMYGNWKSMLRVHYIPTVMLALPLHAPDDPAIKGPRGREVLVSDGDVVKVAQEKQFLQRETKENVPAWLNAMAYTLVIASWLSLILFFGWCYAAASRPGLGTSKEKPREPTLA